MSAFLIHDSTINFIVTALSEYFENNPYLRNKATELELDVVSPNWENKFAYDLFELNCEALRQRYQDTDFPPFHYQPEHAPSSVQAYKSLRCFLYQTLEGVVPETKLYKFIEEFSHCLAYQIVINLSAYEKANWG